MDAVAYAAANALVGNDREAATLEATLGGPELRFEQATSLAICGADLGASLDGAAVPRDTHITCPAGSVLKHGARRSGARAWLAFGGGIDVPRVLGSRSTHVRSALGGMRGRALRAGDVLPLGAATTRPDPLPPVSPVDVTAGGARLRVLPGPQADVDALEALCRARFVVSASSDRMGYRLTGAHVDASPESMISDATFTGAVQLPPSGEPILLMVDRQTIGGYPQVAIVITADLPRAAQLLPGDWVEFEPCSIADARAALVAQEGTPGGR
jgi:antagonist of KipI